MGGLGNQMFQYAFARSLSIKNNTSLRLDLSFLLNRNQPKGFTYRKYELNVFKIDTTIIQDSDLKPFNLESLNGMEKSYYKTLAFFNNPKKILESGFNYDKAYLDSSKFLYLDGYWQSEKYFKDYREQIVKDFSFAEDPNTYYSGLISEAKRAHSVAVHFRRGDYVGNQSTSEFHGACSLEYYAKAMNYLTTQLKKEVHFFMISDDINWVKEHFTPKNNFTFIENNMGDAYEDMRLMSMCKHNIIANSSFSWWGAWLNLNPNKVVIAPKEWFAEPKMQSQTQDLIPSTWIKM